MSVCLFVYLCVFFASPVPGPRVFFVKSRSLYKIYFMYMCTKMYLETKSANLIELN